MMKLTLVASMLLMATGLAQASDGTITFDGKIIDATCTVQVNAKAAGDGTVTLAGVSGASLKKPDDTAGSTNFTIDLTDCKGADVGDGVTAGPKVAVLFEPGTGVNAAGRLTNTGTATGVDLAIYYNAGLTPLDLGVAPAGDYGTIEGGTPSGSAHMPFTVKYYATAALPTAGTVKSNVMYSIIYP